MSEIGATITSPSASTPLPSSRFCYDPGHAQISLSEFEDAISASQVSLVSLSLQPGMNENQNGFVYVQDKAFFTRDTATSTRNFAKS